MDSTTLTAWWGAGAGTGVLLWDIDKWLSKAAKLKIVTLTNASYSDSRVIRTEKTEHGEMTEPATYRQIEVRNVGQSPTTLISITATHTDKRKKGQMALCFPQLLPKVASETSTAIAKSWFRGVWQFPLRSTKV